MTENKYNVRKSIELVQLFEAEAIGSDWDPARIKTQMEEVLRQQLHYRVNYSDIKKTVAAADFHQLPIRKE
jgi:hypothetical protein